MCANSCPKLASSPTTPTSPLYQLGAGGVFFPRAPKKSGPIKRSKSLSDMPDSPVSPTLFKRQAQSMSSLPSMSLVPARGAGGLTPVDEDDVSTEVADFSKFMNLYGQEVLSLSYIQGKGLEELMSAPYRAIYKQRTDDLFNHLSALSVSCLDTEKTYGKEASKQLYFAYIFSQYPEGAQLFSVEGSVLLPLAEALVEAFETMSESVVDIYEDDSYFQFPLHLMQFQDAFDDFQTAFVEWQEKDRIAVLNDMTETVFVFDRKLEILYHRSGPMDQLIYQELQDVIQKIVDQVRVLSSTEEFVAFTEERTQKQRYYLGEGRWEILQQLPESHYHESALALLMGKDTDYLSQFNPKDRRVMVATISAELEKDPIQLEGVMSVLTAIKEDLIDLSEGSATTLNAMLSADVIKERLTLDDPKYVFGGIFRELIRVIETLERQSRQSETRLFLNHMERSLESGTALSEIVPGALNFLLNRISSMHRDHREFILKHDRQFFITKMVQGQKRVFDERQRYFELNLDRTSTWISDIFKTASVLGVSTLESYSPKAIFHLFHAHFIAMIQSEVSLQVAGFPETLHLDRRRLVDLQDRHTQLGACIVLGVLATEIVHHASKAPEEGVWQAFYRGLAHESGGLGSSMALLKCHFPGIDWEVHRHRIESTMAPGSCVSVLIHKRLALILKQYLRVGVLDMAPLKSPNSQVFSKCLAGIASELSAVIECQFRCHGEFYQKALKQAQLVGMTDCLLVSDLSMEDQLPPVLRSQFKPVSIIQKKIKKMALVAAALGVIQQYDCFQRSPKRPRLSSEGAVDQFLRGRPAMAAYVKRKKLSLVEKKAFISDYNSLNLIERKSLSKECLLDWVQDSGVMAIVENEQLEDGAVLDMFQETLPQFLMRVAGYSEEQATQLLKTFLSTLSHASHPGRTLYERQCTEHIDHFLRRGTVVAANDKKTVYLNLFYSQIQSLCREMKGLIDVAIQQLGDDSTQVFPSIPSQLRSGLF